MKKASVNLLFFILSVSNILARRENPNVELKNKSEDRVYFAFLKDDVVFDQNKVPHISLEELESNDRYRETKDLSTTTWLVLSKDAELGIGSTFNLYEFLPEKTLYIRIGRDIDDLAPQKGFFKGKLYRTKSLLSLKNNIGKKGITRRSFAVMDKNGEGYLQQFGGAEKPVPNHIQQVDPEELKFPQQEAA